MRIFIALDIPGDVRGRIIEFMERVRGYAPEARWARPEGLHVTLKFIGEARDAKVEEIKTALAAIKTSSFPVEFSGAGFFPTPKSPRVFWIGVHGGAALSELAGMVDDATHKLGIAREERAYNPHLTLARSGSAPGANRLLLPLQHLVQPEQVPQFGTMTAREFFLYRSELQRGGARYSKLARYALVGEISA